MLRKTEGTNNYVMKLRNSRLDFLKYSIRLFYEPMDNAGSLVLNEQKNI